MEHSEGREQEPVISSGETPENSTTDIPHVLIVQLGQMQHEFRFESREEALAPGRTALRQGWVEIENEKTYLLVMASPNAGVCFLVMSAEEVLLTKTRAMQRHQPAQTQQGAPAPGKRIIMHPTGR